MRYRAMELCHRYLYRVVTLLLLLIPPGFAAPQQEPQLRERNNGPLVLRTEARLIVEDVTVTNAAGKSVEGLPQQAFHILDEEQPQAIRSFEEVRNEQSTMRVVPKHGVLSNASMVDSRTNLNVLLIDPIGIEVADQMFLRQQAHKFLAAMPDATAIAVFRTSRDGRPLLVQSATEDLTLLNKAIDNCVPTLAVSVPPNEVLFNAIGELSNIAEYLGQMKGHKSLIWLAGQFPLAEVLGGNGAQQTQNFDETQEAMKSVYRKLEAARVSVSPVDVRGVVNASVNLSLPVNTTPGALSTPTMLAGGAAAQQGSWSAMDVIASATGGRAFYSNNRLAEQIGSAVDVGRHFYTLAYTPSPHTDDGRWHKIRLTVDGPYSVSYRQGYFAQPSREIQRMEALKTKDRSSFTMPEAPPNVPIVFQARVRPASTPGGGLVIQYAIAASDLSFRDSDDGKRKAQFKVAALSYDLSGRVGTNVIEDITAHYDEAQMETARKIGVPVSQTLPAKRGAKFLLLSVIDLDTGRTGTVQMTLANAQ